ncbi:helix-turn-helix domain-containing protein [Mycobacteroides abscessus]|uniref:helix-turn-helix domain-containing protein n=1 Tax=Mycobacteroides abscessus TaxID=36809 RepID=UPI000C25AE69|nr:helix-turn-helix domain-containing protein [Mycobacteroides abscessus]AWG62958.1 IclR family transcriptional regulator [Mycobacteroides abscessus]PVA73583.1 IclR family transcriptional regulator [Mycobacteroides abscessus]PVB12078.1 IclR family transcriptional regulator [Mycobacteroides abscessus]RIR12740.1 IclR family transcriptional regulator [Mycobacteroides abscessus]RIR81833.1 IclR family transcriptional regulator [Mycobacteroides abscessus]
MNAKVGPPGEPGQDPSPPTRRVVAVVELLAGANETQLTLAEICRELGISRSTGHAILTSLCTSDWVLRDPLSGKYAIGPALPRTSASAVPMSRILRQPLRQLCSTIGMAASLAEISGDFIAVTEATAPGSAQPPVQAGQRLPFVAPFGREFVAWASTAARDEWFNAAGPVNDVYRARMPKILNEVQERGYGLERLSVPLLRVHAALLALTDGDGPDPVSARLAGAVADLTIVDFLSNELAQIEEQPLATISAPIFDLHGNVVMTVSAQPYKQLTLHEVRSIAAHVLDFAKHAGPLIAQSVRQTRPTTQIHTETAPFA